MIKIVAVDLDGTLLDSKKQITTPTKQAINACIEKGIHFAFATGRIANELGNVRQQLPDVRYAITCNGAFVTDLKEKKLLSENTLGMEDVRRIYQLFQDEDMMFELFADGKVLTDAGCMQHPQDYCSKSLYQLVCQTRTGIENFSDYLKKRQRPVGKVNIFFRSAKIRDAAFEKVKTLPFAVTLQEETNLEFNKLGVDKGTGLQMLADYFAVDMREVMAIGDNNNDLAMLQTAGVSVAMENGREAVKKAADFITKSNDQDGVAFALLKFVFEK